MTTRQWKRVFWLAGIAAVAVILFALPGCAEMRFRVTEYQKQTRDTAHKLAQNIAQHGTPPGSIASGVLIGTTREAMLDAGPPNEPSGLMNLLPDGEAKAWETKERQVLALKQKAGLLLDGFKAVLTRLLAGSVPGAVQAAGDALERSGAVLVPEDPALTTLEREAAARATAAIDAVANQASADAARRPTVLDVAQVATTEANWWYELLAPLLAGAGVAGIPAVGLWIKKAGEVVTARQEYETTKRSGQQVILQNQAFMDSAAGQATIKVGDDEITVAAALKAVLGGQDAETRAFVAAAKAGE